MLFASYILVEIRRKIVNNPIKMMESNNLPDTQALETQEFCSEESIYDSNDPYLQVWAKLTYIPNKSGFGKIISEKFVCLHVFVIVYFRRVEIQRQLLRS